MRSFFLFIFSAVFISISAQTTFDFQSKILDSNSKEGLIGAHVIADESSWAITDSKGQFKITLPAGTHVLTIAYLGYLPKTIEVTQGLEIGEIYLEVNPTSLDEILVSGSRLKYKTDFVGSNFRISPRTLEKSNPLNAEEILRFVPGVNIVGDMGLSNRPNISIRGSWGRRSRKIMLLEDGSPAAPAPYIAPGAYYNPVSDRITAIEVYKGADMLRLGPNNMYGAVNYITALPPQTPQLRVKLIGGQRNYNTALLSYGGTWKNLGALVEAVHKNFDGFTDNSSVQVLNLNAKIFAQLSENQSLYFKVSGQYEENQASLSSITPFTFNQDPKQNPFDAEQFSMRRYGLDIIHKWIPGAKTSLISKIYATDFERDWWRQITTVVHGSQVENYVGPEIFNHRYSYLNGLSFGPNDYVRVGRMTNGKESTSDSRWLFTVSGIAETFEHKYQFLGAENTFEAGLKLHQENYKDRFLNAGESRWARTGNVSNDLYYYLWSATAYLRNQIKIDNWSITPIMQVQHIDMYRQNLIKIAQNPNLNGVDEGKERSINNVFLPGISVGYELPRGEIFASAYKGFIAPSKIFGFFVERNGVLVNPLEGENVNVTPEMSFNAELGWRGDVGSPRINLQSALFTNTVNNFIAAGENELFIKPGKINIIGLELGMDVQLWQKDKHELNLNIGGTLLNSRIISGGLVDKDVFGPIVHSSDTKQEFIDRVNSNRGAYDLYVSGNQGQEVLYEGSTIDVATFGAIKRAIVYFGEGKIDDAKVPYTPGLNVSGGLSYSYGPFSGGLNANYVGSQYTEFMNFEAESADGALGKLDAFFTMDVNFQYDFKIGSKTKAGFFINGKNLTNDIYKASRLNRAASGLFPGGFRQIIAGFNLTI